MFHPSIGLSGVARNLNQGGLVFLPFSLFHFLPSPLPSTSHSLFLFSPSPLPFPFPLEVGPLKSSQGIWGSAVSSRSGVCGGAPAEIEFGAF